MKELPRSSIATLAAIYNSALRIGYYPKSWKQAIVLPISKPGKNPKEVTSYRPISLLSSLSKVFEKLIQKRLTKYLLEIRALPDEQFGFRQNYCTTHQLIRLVEQIANGFHNKQHTIGLFLDVEKAFDKVWHTGLLFKLKHLGVPFYLQDIINSFISDRTYRVKVNSALSQTRTIRAGVPQGSALSPLLFNVYFSDIPKLGDSNLALFADDTAIYTTHADINVAKDNIEADVSCFLKWAHQWRIKINPTKTQAKIFTLCKPKFPRPLVVNNTIIPWLASDTPVKYLGVNIDSRLTWKKHIEVITSATYAKISKLYPLINFRSALNLECAMLIFKSIIRPSLTYACPVWNNTANSNIEKLQKIQNKFLRKCAKAPWFISNSQIQRELQIEPLIEHIRKNCDKFFTLLPSSPCCTKFTMGKTLNNHKRIRSRYPKDMYKPP